MKPGLGPEEVHHLRNQFQLFVSREVSDAIERALQTNAAVARLKNYSIIVARFDAHTRAQRKRKINGRSAGVKQIQRPDVDGAPREIDTGWGGGFDDHGLERFGGKEPSLTVGLLPRLSVYSRCRGFLK